jgi:transcription-repair coupling factor (superfamily II helicase)
VSVSARYTQVRDSVDSLYGAEAAACFYQMTVHKKDLLIIAPNDSYARKFHEALVPFFERNHELAGDVPDVIFYPAWDTLPFEPRSPDLTLVSERSRALAKILHNKNSGRKSIFICSVPGIFQKIVPPERFLKQQVLLAGGSLIVLSHLIESLEWIGYRRVTQVEDLGQYAVRGSVIDIFSPSYSDPVRIQMFGDSVESIRVFDCASQKSFNTREEFSALPVREFGFTATDSLQEVQSVVIPNLREIADECSLASSRLRVLEEELRQGRVWNGAEMMSLFLYGEGSTIFQYLPDSFQVLFTGDTEYGSHADSWCETVESQYEFFKNRGDLLPPIDSLYCQKELLSGQGELVQVLRTARIFDDRQERLVFDAPPMLLEKAHSASVSGRDGADIFQKIVSRVGAHIREGYVVLILFPSEEKLFRVRELFEERKLVGKYHQGFLGDLLVAEYANGLYYGISTLPEGFLCTDKKMLVLTERELFSRLNQRVVRRNTYRRSPCRRHVTSLAQIELSDYVVHEQYGIGRFQGLRALSMQGVSGEFLDIEYAGGARLYVPVHDFVKVGKYASSDGAPPSLTRLGTDAWERMKAKVRQNVAALTGSLLKTMAVRSISRGYSFGSVTAEDEWFAGLFPYDETPDQMRAIEDVLSDMNLDKPMDRLVCGDVGFGKTEVALRAAFKAGNNGKQVAILVPTTILAEQHYRTFAERFEATPLRVQVLSRFVPRKEQDRVISELREGKTDIVIGTHRLLQSDIAFKDLGLLVIDEEHRFGVAHKERFKQLRAEVDVLSLSATPIPRTLQMSLFGTKDMSIIESPPVDRQAVHTEVLPYDEEVCIEAIRREITRGGQVFVVNHFIDGLDEIAAFIERRLPEARVAIVHGRVQRKILESRMHDFYQGKVQILVATSIIESGLDISNANTMIILKSEQFGLAQLYQLRGRVGRSSRKGYAYLFHSHQSILPDDAKKRLHAMAHMDEMGIGYRVALQDMEIRGAGSLLGKDQSGHVQLLGYETYIKVLEEAVLTEKSRRGQITDNRSLALFPAFEPDVSLGIDAYIPEEFVPDINERLLMYQVISGLCHTRETETFYEDMEDQFGTIPEAIRSLVFLMRVRNYCKELGIQKFLRKDAVIFMKLLPVADIFDVRKEVVSGYKEVVPDKELQYRIVCLKDSASEEKLILDLFSRLYISLNSR